MSRSGAGNGWHHALRVLLGAGAGLLWLGACDPAAAASRPAPEAAKTLQRQTELLDSALKALRPAADGQPHSTLSVLPAMGRRLCSSVRCLRCANSSMPAMARRVDRSPFVNHASTLNVLPLASAGNLDRTLQHLGKLMDPSRDVLFLFLTSHGEDGLFAVEMPRFDLKPLRPESLKDMLKRSGIKNSVIVLSACHSGSFLPALADPTTLVIAAARADRSSLAAMTGASGPTSARPISNGPRAQSLLRACLRARPRADRELGGAGQA